MYQDEAHTKLKSSNILKGAGDNSPGAIDIPVFGVRLI